MIKKFEVENFKGFKNKLTFDFTAREYEFNKNILKDGIVNKAIIYGKNGVGKSSLGIALFDITRHLTDKERMPEQYLYNYINLETGKPHATFTYTFQFDDDEIVYEYKKRDPDYLICEKLTINGKVAIDYDYFNPENRFVDTSISGTLNIDLIDNKLSVLKYIYRNTPTNTSAPLAKMMKFAENMLWYRRLSEGNAYCGFSNGNTFLTEELYQSGKVKEFEDFLKQNGIHYTLKFELINGEHVLMAVFGNTGNKTRFHTIASTGTQALLLFYFWGLSAFGKISFLFIDEFDAFLHYESAANIVRQLNKSRQFQSVLTTHNTYLMQNKLTRPDCCYIMTDNRITSLFNSTNKEIREAHNLEKMYVNGAFNE